MEFSACQELRNKYAGQQVPIEANEKIPTSPKKFAKEPTSPKKSPKEQTPPKKFAGKEPTAPKNFAISSQVNKSLDDNDKLAQKSLNDIETKLNNLLTLFAANAERRLIEENNALEQQINGLKQKLVEAEKRNGGSCFIFFYKTVLLH